MHFKFTNILITKYIITSFQLCRNRKLQIFLLKLLKYHIDINTDEMHNELQANSNIF